MVKIFGWYGKHSEQQTSSPLLLVLLLMPMMRVPREKQRVSCKLVTFGPCEASTNNVMVPTGIHIYNEDISNLKPRTGCLYSDDPAKVGKAAKLVVVTRTDFHDLPRSEK